jgi:hypothetical protein
MLVARYRSIIVGVVLGSLALFLTYHSGNFVATDPNPVMRALNAVAFAMVVPGFVAAIAMGKLEAGPFWIVAAVNFLFWFGFGWLIATFVTKFLKLRRAIAAVKP